MEDYICFLDKADVENTVVLAKKNIVKNLESGKIIYSPGYALLPNDDEQIILSADILDKKSKNISYCYLSNKISGLSETAKVESIIQKFMHRYALFAKNLVDTIAPEYKGNLIWGRTSYRPAEIKGRSSSKRKDDTRVHVDSFPSTPVHGKRILRVFCNINPNNAPRIWHIGEPFSDLVGKFAYRLPRYSNCKANLLKLIRATKSKRTAYDHYMLKLHDTMKLDDNYQSKLDKKRFDFPATSTWMVFTDLVSHAALSGQFLLEQTFYLPIDKMQNMQSSPLQQLKKIGLSQL